MEGQAFAEPGVRTPIIRFIVSVSILRRGSAPGSRACVRVGRGTSCSSSPMPTASPGKEEEACSSRRVRGGGGWTCSLASMYSRGPPGRGEGEGSRSRQEREAALGKEVRGEGRWTGSLTAEPGRGSTWGREVERSCVSPDRPGTKLRVAGAAQGGVPQAAGHVCGWGGGQVRHRQCRQLHLGRRERHVRAGE